MQIHSSGFTPKVGLFVSHVCWYVCARMHKSTCLCVRVCVSRREEEKEAKIDCLCVCHYCLLGFSKTLPLKQDSLWQKNLTRLWWALGLKLNYCLCWVGRKINVWLFLSCLSHFASASTCHKMFWLWLCNGNMAINSYFYLCYCY